MKTIEIKIDGALVCFVEVPADIGNATITHQLLRVVDRFASMREITMAAMNRTQNDVLFARFLDRVAAENGVSASAILSKSRRRPLPMLRAIVASVWMSLSLDRLCVVADRVGLNHSSVLSGIDRLPSEAVPINKRAFEICKEVLSK